MGDRPSAERWRRVEELYHAAIALPAGERGAFVSAACGDDQPLRREVESLLAVAVEAETFLEPRRPSPAAGPARFEHPSMVGRAVGPYQVTALIGAGGMGEVYRATDTRLGRDVAMKVLRGAFGAQPEHRRRFGHEARAAAALNHPNILAVFDIGTHEGAPYFISELLEGETVRDLLLRGDLPGASVVDFALQIASGLAAAHDKGIVHRDVKPENLFVTGDERVKILDFGVAKLTEGVWPRGWNRSTLDTTTPGVLIGTIGYMSPEQVRGQPVDHRSDVFSFGAVLYEMATGRRAFARETAADTLSAILNEEPPPVDAAGSPAAARALRVARRCLEKSPTARPASCRDVARALAEAVSPPLAEPVSPAPSRPPRVLGAARRLSRAIGAWVESRLPPHSDPDTIRSIAVLPLAHVSRDPDDAYFADSMTGALIDNLARIRALRVVSRTSAMQYKHTRRSLRAIGRDLDVDAIVEGSVERVGNRVRISARLTRAATAERLWAEVYDRDLRDVLVLQSEVAGAIAREVRVALTPDERARFGRAREVDPLAHQLYLKGRFLWDQRTEDSIRRSIAYYEQALERDPDYAVAYSGLADCYLSLGFSFDVGSLPPGEAIPQAKAAAVKALSLDDTLAEAHNSLAYAVLNYDWDWQAAEAGFRRSLELNPGYAEAHHWYSHLLIASGRIEESLAESRRALELDRLNPIMNTHLGWHYFFARQNDRALEQLTRTLELDPNYGLAYWYRGLAHEQQARYPEALSEMRRGADLLKGNVVVAADIGHVHAASGAADEAHRVMAELERASERRYVSSFEIALIHIGLGRPDPAFDWLEKAYRERSDLLVYLRVDPRLDPVRSDPRLADLCQRIGIPSS